MAERDELDQLDLGALSELIHRRELSSSELTEHALGRIEATDSSLQAFVTATADRARAEAAAADRALAAGESRGPLHGLPYAAKDLFDVAGLPTGAGTHLLADNVAATDGVAVRRLADAGMVLVGKTHTVQFAYGGAGINHDTGSPRNPWSPADPHVSGGSSSGSGSAVAAGVVPMALGTDTSGSVRIPASLCGVTGLKTTVGRIPRSGVYPLSSTLDSVGPLARSVRDCAWVYEALQGADPDDRSTAGQLAHDVTSTLADGVAGLTVAVVETFFFDDVDPEIDASVRAAADLFGNLGAEVVTIEAPELDEVMGGDDAPYRSRTVAAEGYAVNRRFLEGSFDELDPVVARRMLPGADLSAVDYLRAFDDWHRLRASFDERTAGIDVFLAPSTMIPAKPVAEVDETADSYARLNAAYLRNTSIANRFEWCALSVPCGFTAAGLPIGLMIQARSMQEHTVLRAGHAFQEATDWHRRRPG